MTEHSHPLWKGKKFIYKHPDKQKTYTTPDSMEKFKRKLKDLQTPIITK
jgi:ribosomal protein L31